MTREEAIKILKDLSDCSYIGSLASEDIEALKMAIKALEQEPRKGHWITHHESMTLLTGETTTGGVVCSECGYKTHNKAHVLIGCPYKYCPDCGAKMVEPQESEET